MTDTRRTQVLDAIVTLFEGMTLTVPISDGVVWSVVTRDPLAEIPAGKRNALGVYGGTSTRTTQTYGKTVTLPVVIEVYSRVPAGEVKALNMETLLGVVERALMADRTLGGVCVSIDVEGEQVNIDSPYANQVDGALFLTIKYMQSETDPRLNRGN